MNISDILFFDDILSKLYSNKNESNSYFYVYYTYTGMIVDIIENTSSKIYSIKDSISKIFELHPAYTSHSNGSEPLTKSCFLFIEKQSSKNLFPSTIHDLSRAIIPIIENKKNYYSIAISQCTAHEIINKRYLLSAPDFAKEYLLWDDNQLWDPADWAKQITELKKRNNSLTEQQAKQYLAWIGAGWMANRLADALPTPTGFSWNYLPQIAYWTKNALEDLASYDLALVNFLNQQGTPEVLSKERCNNYIRTLCDFLPYHYSRGEDDQPDKSDPLPSNSYADKGGPRLWQGILHPRMHMHLRHLIQESWITLWPYQGKHYFQPASMALLYWAARQMQKPWTNSTEEFLHGYDWSNPLWFGGMWNEPKN